jgi:pimeloyl-ACP methyl ester carboxylesterase
MKKVFIAILALLVLSPFAVIFLRPNKIIAKEKARERFANENSHFIKWKDAEIHYVDEGEGTPIIMIHGFGGSHRNFYKVAQILKKDFRVIRVDLPGFGLSDFPASEANNKDLIKLYREYMSFMLNDALQLDSVYLIGNSLGGWMAWETTVDNPDKVKKLTLVCSAGYEMDKVSNNAAALLKNSFVQLLFLRGMPLSFSEDGAKKCYYDHSKINTKEVENNNALWNREGNIEAAFRMAGSGQYPDTTRIEKIQCPTLIVWGKEDEIIPAEHANKFKGAIKNSTLVMYNNCGHVPMIENTEKTAVDILKFALNQNTIPN